MLRDLIMRYNSDGGGRVQQVERDLEAWDQRSEWIKIDQSQDHSLYNRLIV